jgi:hypothetical protein
MHAGTCSCCPDAVGSSCFAAKFGLDCIYCHETGGRGEKATDNRLVGKTIGCWTACSSQQAVVSAVSGVSSSRAHLALAKQHTIDTFLVASNLACHVLSEQLPTASGAPGHGAGAQLQGFHSEPMHEEDIASGSKTATSCNQSYLRPAPRANLWLPCSNTPSAPRLLLVSCARLSICRADCSTINARPAHFGLGQLASQAWL